MDSGEATEVSPKGCPRWRQRNHTGIDSSDNRVFAGMNPLKRVAFQRESALGAVSKLSFRPLPVSGSPRAKVEYVEYTPSAQDSPCFSRCDEGALAVGKPCDP